MVFGLIGEATSQSNQTDAARTAKLAEEAYIYAFPILMSYKTMYQHSTKNDVNYKAPFNELKNTARIFGPKDTTVISASSDTPYSLLWMDLRAEPMVLNFLKIENNERLGISAFRVSSQERSL